MARKGRGSNYKEEGGRKGACIIEDSIKFDRYNET